MPRVNLAKRIIGSSGASIDLDLEPKHKPREHSRTERKTN